MNGLFLMKWIGADGLVWDPDVSMSGSGGNKISVHGRGISRLRVETNILKYFGTIFHMVNKSRNPMNDATKRPPVHPLAEIFGFPFDNQSDIAARYRCKRLCPFNNKVPNCTKNKANDPLGTCSIFDGDDPVITCPVRFRQNWIIADDAADFFFPENAQWTSLTEVRLKDKHGKTAGNIDVVLVSYDNHGRVIDFGALEIQAVYISGNVRRPFEWYMRSPEKNAWMDWCSEINNPRPDYLSSSRKRLAPQLLYKGGILNAWRKKSAVAIGSGFFRTLPRLEQIPKHQADMAWLVYDLVYDGSSSVYQLKCADIVYTRFNSALSTITKSEPGDVNRFLAILQDKLDEKLEENNPPDAPTLNWSMEDDQE
uniref:Restriction endonuclease NotI n=1 Tax=Candidatus Kentrum sp. MB TaxID=2138164 RepID=A0A450XPN0_9GAMM|nr:MAG: Restriction endonuclease NotI [Candidatus Kentron sp. MB]